ncbi:hypothetical protein U1Q18_031089, partial [Sarracenia purpurea var. burkii]
FAVVLAHPPLSPSINRSRLPTPNLPIVVASHYPCDRRPIELCFITALPQLMSLPIDANDTF